MDTQSKKATRATKAQNGRGQQKSRAFVCHYIYDATAFNAG